MVNVWANLPGKVIKQEAGCHIKAAPQNRKNPESEHLTMAEIKLKSVSRCNSNGSTICVPASSLKNRCKETLIKHQAELFLYGHPEGIDESGRGGKNPLEGPTLSAVIKS